MSSNNFQSVNNTDLLINPRKRQKLNQQIEQFNTDLINSTNANDSKSNNEFKLVFNRENFDDDDMYDDDDEEDEYDEEEGDNEQGNGLNKKTKLKKNGKKKTKGRVKIKMEFIENKIRRYTTFSKRKTGIMKKVCSWLINRPL